MTSCPVGFRSAVLLAALLVPSARAGAEDRTAVVVEEPGELTRRNDLVGRTVVVDDRVRLFQYHKETGFDEILLKRAPEVRFALPSRLRPAHPPQAAAVKVRGVLRHAKGRWWVDVEEYQPLPSDLDRLNRAVAVLPRTDVEARTAWARWGEKRGRDFGDEALLSRAREIEGEALRAAADRPPAHDPASYWLGLAEQAREHKVAEPEPSALAHRGFRAAMAEARTAEALKTLVGRIEAFFPGASKPLDDPADLSRWEKPYQGAPADAYRSAPERARATLDHRLWADATQALLERRSAESPRSQLALAEEAARLLPDRPSLTTRFLEKGAEAASGDVGSLRQSEVETLSRLYRDALHQPEKSRALYRAWLDEQKHRRLSPRDAEGRIALAERYETYLDDRSAALALLREAWKIDPESREVSDAFRRRGLRKVQGEWVEPPRARSAQAHEGAPQPEASPALQTTAQTPSPAPTRTDSLRNATPEEVILRLGGKPSRQSRIATRGQIVEQWIYAGNRQNRYVTFLRKPGDAHPRVISYYSLPSTARKHPVVP